MALDNFMEFDENNFDPGHITETELSKEIRRDFLCFTGCSRWFEAGSTSYFICDE